MLITFQWHNHGYDSIRVGVVDASSLESIEFPTMNPTPERRLSADGFQDQKRVKPAPTSGNQPSSGRRNSLRHTMSISRRNSSWLQELN